MSVVLIISIPLLAAFVSILNKKIAPYLLLVVSFGILVLLGFDLIELGTVTIGGFAAPYGISLILDSYSFTGIYIVNILFFLVVAVTFRKYAKMASILLVALAGLNGLLLTGDLFNLFVFIEVSGIAAYLITTTNKKPVATFNYLVLGTVGSSLYLLGLIILYAMFGTLNMADLAVNITASSATATQVALPFLLMFIGLGVEAKLLPFNSWVKGILGSSNKLSGPMIASVYATTMALVFGRLLTNVFVISDQLMLIISVVLIFSILAGEAMAYASSKLREVLLFSSIAQAAIVIMLFVLGFTWFGLVLAILNGFSKLVLFLIVNTVTDQTETDEVNDLRGLFTENKLVGAAFSITVLSVLGLPLFIGFIVKMNILMTLVDNGNLLFVIAILASSVVEGVYFIKILIKLWFEKGEVKKVKFDNVTKYIVVVIALAIVVFGIYFEPLREILNNYTNFMIGGIL
ncbi:NADH-quinone oxidoreductase subunit N [Candidatus Izimaplasma bacterium HR1]|jgi:multicomponent Na+:H+ antiporter subunit D|uniref:complex I subunit 5 family protein n=1 Tax=Candidatus Izimoplasma sp. HR1 TaxID=1541959 RepID=UPI0004F6AF51|nr:NADH-quinone oxidoreductase subunit N [Candidatus Izimaplasma bacterium HR1]